jgi:hypothetical protein
VTGPATPDPVVVVLGEIRDVLVEIRDAVRPKEARIAEAMRPTSSEPRKRPTQGHIIG